MLRAALLFAAIVLAVAGLFSWFGPDSLVRLGDAVLVSEAPKEVAAPAAGTYDRRVVIRADRRGHFMVDATVGGRSVEFMVDTGATVVALTEETARRLGIRPARRDYTDQVRTANGIVKVAPVMLDEIAIGAVRVSRVRATVIPGEALGINLLGMSFLRQLRSFEVSGDQLVLLD